MARGRGFSEIGWRGGWARRGQRSAISRGGLSWASWVGEVGRRWASEWLGEARNSDCWARRRKWRNEEREGTG